MKVAIDFCLRNEAIEYWDEAKVQDFKLDDDFLKFWVYEHDTVDKAKAEIKNLLLFHLNQGYNPSDYEGVSHDRNLMWYQYNTFCTMEGRTVVCVDDKVYEVVYEHKDEEDCEDADMKVKSVRLALEDEKITYELDNHMGWITGTYIADVKCIISQTRMDELDPCELIKMVEGAIQITDSPEEYSHVNWDLIGAYSVELLKDLAASDNDEAADACYLMFQILNDEVSEGMFGWPQDGIEYLKEAAEKGCYKISTNLMIYLENEFPEVFNSDDDQCDDSLEELIDSITADDLCDVQDGTFTKVYEEYGLKAAENFIWNINYSSKMFELHDYLEQHEMDRATFLKAGEESSSIAAEVCFNYWYRANNLLNLKYVEEEFFRYTAQEIQLGEKLEDTFLFVSFINEESDSSLLLVWQPSLIKKYGLEAIIPYFLEKFADENFLDPFYSHIDDYSFYIGDILSILPEYTDRDEVFTIMENLLFRNNIIEDVRDLYVLIQKHNCAPIMHEILDRFTEGDIWEQLVYGNDKYLYFLERLCLILELTKGKNGLIDFLTSLVPILDANRDSEVAEDIINSLYQMDFPYECTLLTDFINEYFGDEDE